MGVGGQLDNSMPPRALYLRERPHTHCIGGLTNSITKSNFLKLLSLLNSLTVSVHVQGECKEVTEYGAYSFMIR